MKNLIIVGAGGFGRELCGYAEDCIADGAPWRIKGFLDENADALAGYDYPWGIVGAPSSYAPQTDDVFVLALGLPKTKKTVVEAMLDKGAMFETLIHPSVRLGRNVKVGQGCVFCPNAGLTCDVTVGDFVTFNCFSGCGHDAVVGRWSTLSAHCDVTGFAKLGEGVFLGSGVCVKPSGVVGDWSTVGINSSVIMRIKPGVTAYGNPAVTIRAAE